MSMTPSCFLPNHAELDDLNMSGGYCHLHPVHEILIILISNLLKISTHKTGVQTVFKRSKSIILYERGTQWKSSMQRF